MAALPSYVTVLFDGYGEAMKPSVERVEMERGMPKQRRINSRPMVEVTARLLFKDAADASAFEVWYVDEIKQAGQFTLTHPRTGGTITAQFKGGDIGTLVPMIPDFSWCQRTVTLEHLR